MTQGVWIAADLEEASSKIGHDNAGASRSYPSQYGEKAITGHRIPRAVVTVQGLRSRVSFGAAAC